MKRFNSISDKKYRKQIFINQSFSMIYNLITIRDNSNELINNIFEFNFCSINHALSVN